MRRRMTRGKQQILFNYLPGRTVDFEGGVIAKISHIRGIQVRDLNVSSLLSQIREQASAWPDEFRPGLRDDILLDATRFVILDPKSVEAEFYPKVFWCSNPACGRVFDFARRRGRLQKVCPNCGSGSLNQLRWILVHRCGDIRPLSPYCQTCSSSENMALDTRGSERVSNFKWVCRSCASTQDMFPGPCRACNWAGPPRLRQYSIEVHRAGKTFNVHTTTLLNVPSSRYAGFFATPQWKALTAAKFLGMPPIDKLRFDSVRGPTSASANDDVGISASNLDSLLKRQQAGELSTEQLLRELESARQRNAVGATGRFTSVPDDLVAYSGVGLATWEESAQELLETVLTSELSEPRSLLAAPPYDGAAALLGPLGIGDINLVDEFPIVVASYGYSRMEAVPRRPGGTDVLCRLNSFPQDREHGGRFPIYVDETTADALFVSLDATKVVRWLIANGCTITLPVAANQDVAARAYMVSILSGQRLRETIPDTAREARMVFSLLHTLSHLLVKEAALLCGLERTSLAEYLLPRSLSFAIYCNHKSGQTIGALTALFEQSIGDWLAAALDRRRCVYDPVCKEDGGACHSCAHLSETSCRFFNMNLSRAFLFGGNDTVLGNVVVGYLDMPA